MTVSDDISDYKPEWCLALYWQRIYTTTIIACKGFYTPKMYNLQIELHSHFLIWLAKSET